MKNNGTLKELQVSKCHTNNTSQQKINEMNDYASKKQIRL